MQVYERNIKFFFLKGQSTYIEYTNIINVRDDACLIKYSKLNVLEKYLCIVQ